MEAQETIKKLQTKEFKKGTILLRPGEYSRYAFQVLNGCLKSYIVDKTGKEYIMQFAPEGWVISDMDSYVNKTPATLFIEAIEDTEVILMNEPFPSFFSDISSGNSLELIHKLTNNIIAANRRMALLLSSTAEERYLNFLDTYPVLAQRLPLKLIASYIGITPEYLSEIRNKMTKKPGPFIS